MSPFTGSAARTPGWEHLRVAIADGVATVTLARPEKLNALTFGAYADLRDLLAELSRERSSPWPRTSASPTPPPASPSCSPASASPAGTWARPTSCPASSAWATRPAC